MATRKVLLTVVGHVDHGKTSLLDKIRQTAVTKGEAGGITQAVGVSIIPMETIKKICGPLLNAFKGKLSVPGLLAIDTPGHAAFTSLRKRGGSLADIAILIVDITEGFKPQTIESIEILKANKVPFIIAANKIDLIHGWQFDKEKLLLQNINNMNPQMQGEFEKKLYELVGTVAEHGLQSERFDRVENIALRFVGFVLIDQGLDHVEHFGNVVGGFRFFSGRCDIELSHVLIKRRDVFAVDLLPVDAFFVGAVDDLVINVGEVAHEVNVVTEVLEITVKSVEDNGGTGVPHMAVVVNGDPAYIHADLLFFQGNEFFFFSGQGVEDL